VFPLSYECFTRDNVIVLLSPLEHGPTPKTASEIQRRSADLAFNSTFLREMRMFAHLRDGDLDGAMLTVRRELEINPSDAHANRDLAATLFFLGRWEEALRQLDIAERLNPLDPSHLDKVHGMACISLIALGRYHEALVRARRLEAISPRSASPYLTAAAAHARRGEMDAARQDAAEVLRRRPQFVIGAAPRGSTAPAYLEGLRHVDDGLRLAGLPERAASASR